VPITAVHLLRGPALLPAWLMDKGSVTPFIFWSSVICLGYGGFHLIGLVQEWARLSRHPAA
jgi:hypothetical protein